MMRSIGKRDVDEDEAEEGMIKGQQKCEMKELLR
jgi:hypothetical protein